MEDVTGRGAQTPIFVGYNPAQAKAIVEKIARMQAWSWQHSDKWRIPEFNIRLEEMLGDVDTFLGNMIGESALYYTLKQNACAGQVLRMARQRCGQIRRGFCCASQNHQRRTTLYGEW